MSKAITKTKLQKHCERYNLDKSGTNAQLARRINDHLKLGLYHVKQDNSVYQYASNKRLFAKQEMVTRTAEIFKVDERTKQCPFCECERPIRSFFRLGVNSIANGYKNCAACRKFINGTISSKEWREECSK